MPTRDVAIIEATTPEHIALARVLMREYAQALAAELGLSLDYQGFDAEMDALPGKYAPPVGCILLAQRHSDGAPLGCIAVRPLAEAGYAPTDPRPACEMKRMYVRPAARSLGVGRALGEASLAFARRAGYRLMKLDTDVRLAPATRLYESMGFVACDRYNDDPHEATRWYEQRLD